MTKNAVIYARYSCEKQTEQSIEGQLRVCNEFAERNGFTVIENYIDRAVSGKTDKREQFQQMLKDSAKQEFNYVLVYKLDRFARNRYDSAINKATLKKNGVKVLSACEQITDTPEGIILESLIDGMAEYYSAELSQKVKRGMRESCLKGNAAGIQPIFGYCIVNKKYQIVESEAAIVRKLFADYVGGKSIKELMDWLNSNGIRNHRGHAFLFNAVSAMLHNPKYIGKCIYSGEVYDNMIEPIIDEKTFYRAQELLIENVDKAGRTGAIEKYILSGKLICAECGQLMIGESGTGHKGELYTYYKCAAKKKDKHSCPSRAVRKDVIEKAVYDAIIRALQDDNFIYEVARKAAEIHNADLDEPQELKILKRQKADIDKQLENITNAICQGIFNQNTQARMIELSNTQQALEAQIAEEEARTVLPLKEARVVSFLRNYTEVVKCSDKAENLKNMKRLFDVFIKEVIFDGERFLIIMKTTDEPLDLKKRQKEEAIRKKFELLRFGELPETRIEPMDWNMWRYFGIYKVIRA